MRRHPWGWERCERRSIGALDTTESAPKTIQNALVNRPEHPKYQQQYTKSGKGKCLLSKHNTQHSTHSPARAEIVVQSSAHEVVEMCEQGRHGEALAHARAFSLAAVEELGAEHPTVQTSLATLAAVKVRTF